VATRSIIEAARGKIDRARCHAATENRQTLSGSDARCSRILVPESKLAFAERFGISLSEAQRPTGLFLP
jgi:hypothetical protein